MRTVAVLFSLLLSGNLLYAQAPEFAAIPAQARPDTLSAKAPGCLQVVANPAAAEVSLLYHIDAPGAAALTIADAAGKLSITTYPGMQEAGSHVKTFSTSALGNGAYNVMIEVNGKVCKGKFHL